MDDKDMRKQKESFTQQQTNEQHNPKYNQLIKVSPFYSIYKSQFQDNVKIPDLQKFSQILDKKQITLVKNYDQTPAQFEVLKIETSKNNKIIKFRVICSYFMFYINVLNLSQKDSLKVKFYKPINSGIFGSVHEGEYNGKILAVKQIAFKTQNASSVIYNAIKEFSIMKVLSIFQVAPLQQNLFGFDLVTTDNSVYFSTQKCIPLNKIIKENNQQITQFLTSLKISLLILHTLHFTHCDIKPENIMFSPSLNKPVFIDFGLSQINTQNIGEMKEQMAKGSLYYCSQEMRKLFISNQGKGYIDTYYNDLISLQKSISEMKKSFWNDNSILIKSVNNQNKPDQPMIQKVYQIRDYNFVDFNKKSYQLLQNPQMNKYRNKQDKKQMIKNSTVCINMIHLIYTENLNKIERLIGKNSYILYILAEEMQRIQFIFLEVRFSLKLYKIYVSLVEKIKELNLSVFFLWQSYHEHFLRPYFAVYLNKPVMANLVEKNYLNERLIEREKLCRRVFSLIGNNQSGIKDNGCIEFVFNLDQIEQKGIKQIVFFLTRIQPKKKFKIAQKIYLKILNFTKQKQCTSLTNLNVLNKMFSQFGVLMTFHQQINKIQGYSVKTFKIYLNIIYLFYLDTLQNYSSLKHLQFCCHILQQQNTNNKFTKQIKHKCHSFIKKLQSQTGKKNSLHLQTLNQEDLLYELSILQLIPSALKIIAYFYQIVKNYKELKSIICQIIELFDDIVIQHLSLGIILMTVPQKYLRFAQTIKNYGDSLILSLLQAKVKIMGQFWSETFSNFDLKQSVDIISTFFSHSRIINLPQNFSKLLTENQIKNDDKQILSILNQKSKYNDLYQSQNIEQFKRYFSIVFIKALIPEQMVSDFGIVQNYIKVYNTLCCQDELNFHENSLKEGTLTQLCWIFRDQDLFTESLLIFEKWKGSKEFPFETTLQASLFKVNNQVEKISFIHPIAQAFYKYKRYNIKIEKENFKLDCPQDNFIHQKIEKSIINNRSQSELDFNKLYSYSENERQERLKLIPFLNNHWKLVEQQSDYSNLEFISLTLKFFIRITIFDGFQNIQAQIEKYLANQQKFILIFQQLLTYLNKNKEVSQIIFSSFDFKQDQLVWQNIIKLKILSIKLFIFSYISTQLNQLKFLINSNVFFKNNFLHLKNTVLHKCQQQIKSYVQQNFKQQVPLFYYQISVKLQISILKCQGLTNEIQKQSFFQLVDEYLNNLTLSQKSYLSLQIKSFENKFLTAQKIKNPFLNTKEKQMIFIDLLIQSYKGMVPQMRKIIIKNCRKINISFDDFINEQQMMKYLIKLVFFYMKQNKQISRFFQRSQTYLNFIYSLLNIYIEEPLGYENQSLSLQDQNTQNFISSFFIEILQFSSNLPCKQYSYFSIQIVEYFFSRFSNQSNDQIRFQLFKKLQLMSESICNKICQNKINMGIILIVQSEKIKQKYFKKLLQQNDLKNFPSSKKAEIRNFLQKSQQFLIKTCQYIDDLELLAKNYVIERIYKVLLLFLDNKRNFLLRTNFQLDSNNIERHEKIVSNGKKIKLMYFRSIKRIIQKMNCQKKTKYLIDLDFNSDLEKIFHQVSYQQFQSLLKDQFRYFSLKENQTQQSIEVKKSFMLPDFLLEIINKKIYKRKQNLNGL